MFLQKKKVSFKLLFVLVLLITFLTHITYLPNGFTWLDHGDIERKRAIVALDQLPQTFTSRFGDTGFYRPLVTILNSTDAAIYGNYAPGYHFTNALLHLAATAAVPLFLIAFFSFNPLTLLLATLFFGIHPISFLPVGAISYRQEILLSLFLFLSIFLHARSRTTGRKLYFVLAVITIFFALLSKETAVVLLPLWIIVWEWKNQKIQSPRLTKLFLLELAIIGIYILLRFTSVPDIWRTPFFSMNFYQSITVRLFLFGKQLLNLLSPIVPSLSDAVSFDSQFILIVLFALVVIITSIVVIKKQGLKKDISLAIILLFISLAPALNLVPIPRLASPHYAYIAIPSFAALFVFIFKRVPNKKIFDISLKTIIVTVWFVIAIQSVFFSGFRFTNDYTLFKPETDRDHHFLEGYFYLGNFYLEHQQYQLAEPAFQHALNPQNGFFAYTEKHTALINLAAVYFVSKQLDKADATLVKAEKTAPESIKQSIIYNRALIARQQKNYEKVVTLLTRDQAVNNPVAVLLLADALHNLNRNDEAITILKQSLPHWPIEQKGKVQALIQELSSINE